MTTDRSNGERLLRIGELASQTNTTLRTLHYYEELGLVCPERRTKGGFRLYRPDALDRLRLVLHLRELGLDLPQIQAFLAAKHAPTGAARELRSTIERELRRVKSLLYRYAVLRDELDSALDIVKECERRQCVRTPGGSACPDCEVVSDRECVPTTFMSLPQTG
ncbi:MerR family transcriptional regulator [Candidatus Poribacteria bacterium]|nr:MerR family transcriptional regulator [Candidatus Poribacteria bacterium]